MSGVNEIRSSFLDYFARNGHEIVPSSPLVPRNDPTLMFTNAGMVQFKNVFTGVEKRPYSRATTAQKCVRAGGKHNDLDNVGYTARHHTFFEMLGNFSFGDYFKDRAIELAWNLVTKEVRAAGRPPHRHRLHRRRPGVQALEEDLRAAESRIIRIAGSDNFCRWATSAPAARASEIFYDHGERIPGGPPGSDNADGDRFIEIWNLVFIAVRAACWWQVRRAAAALDRYRHGARAHRRGAAGHPRQLQDRSVRRDHLPRRRPDRRRADGPQGVSHRVIADHLRASAFLIAAACCPRTRAAAMCSAASCAAPCATPSSSAPRTPLIWKLVPLWCARWARPMRS